MTGGLVADHGEDASAPDLEGAGTVEYTTAPVTGPEASHLDSFIATSGWTREDLQVVMSIAQTLILLYWLYLEVRR